MRHLVHVSDEAGNEGPTWFRGGRRRYSEQHTLQFTAGSFSCLRLQQQTRAGLLMLNVVHNNETYGSMVTTLRIKNISPQPAR